MRIKEMQRDIFTLPKDYVIAHAVSADFTMGGGLALQVVHNYPELRKFLFALVKQGYAKPQPKLDCVFPFIGQDGRTIYQLVTKTNVWQNAQNDKEPNLDTLKIAFDTLKTYMKAREQTKLGLPLIGCGLDQMKWEEVLPVIEESFKDTQFDIVVCIYGN